jgi:hypothetical protein
VKLQRRKFMAKKIVEKTYIVYGAQAMTMSLADARILFSTQNRQEAIEYANEYKAAVYAYDIGKNGELISATFVYHAADEETRAHMRREGLST